MNAMDVLNAALDAALDCRVALHRLREQKAVGVEDYKAGLAAVRAVEDRLEPLRRDLGAEDSRAFEGGAARAEGPEPPIPGQLSIEDQEAQAA